MCQIKTDANGEEEWNQIYGGSIVEYGFSGQQTNDNGYIFTGWTNSYGSGGSDVWLIKTDANGEEEWNQTYGGSSWDQGLSAQQTTDGGYIVTGWTESYGSGGTDMWLIRLEGDGEEPPPSEINVDYQSEWNLVGLPLEVENNNYLAIFQDAIENTLFSFDESYLPDSTLIQGEGYWLRFDTTGTTTITGNPIDELTISLSEGWNLVSGLHFDLSIFSINDPDTLIVPNTLFGFFESYFSTEQLIPGKGYWLRAYQDGEVTITDQGLARVTPQDYRQN